MSSAYFSSKFPAIAGVRSAALTTKEAGPIAEPWMTLEVIGKNADVLIHCFITALDFSKAFDTVRHVTLLQKLAQLDISDCVYNWMVEFFSGHIHCTRFSGLVTLVHNDLCRKSIKCTRVSHFQTEELLGRDSTKIQYPSLPQM